MHAETEGLPEKLCAGPAGIPNLFERKPDIFDYQTHIIYFQLILLRNQ